jgi:hypothetical protein
MQQTHAQQNRTCPEALNQQGFEGKRVPLKQLLLSHSTDCICHKLCYCCHGELRMHTLHMIILPSFCRQLQTLLQDCCRLDTFWHFAVVSVDGWCC